MFSWYDWRVPSGGVGTAHERLKIIQKMVWNGNGNCQLLAKLQFLLLKMLIYIIQLIFKGPKGLFSSIIAEEDSFLL